MSIRLEKLSEPTVQGAWLAPDDEHRLQLTTDFEQGPIAVGDTSEGLKYQKWSLSYADPVITLTPEDIGLPVIADISPAGCNQISFCFDQNANVTIAYVASGQAYLYWYDSVAASFVTSTLDADVVSVILTLDDKRATQYGANDILLFYTREIAPGVYNLEHSVQRERFLTPRLLAEGTYPYLSKCGMSDENRVQIALRVFI